ncbi:MAG: hypothetical protein U0V54_10135 [Saprospiraceae bacterium]
MWSPLPALPPPAECSSPHPHITEEAVPFNMEADSLNAMVLGADVKPGNREFNIFIKVRKEITIKCGQKCTAVRHM